MALVIDSLETSKRALQSFLSIRVSGASSPAYDRLLQREIDTIDLGLLGAASPRSCPRRHRSRPPIASCPFPAPFTHVASQVAKA